jgi:hypothetical protein
MAGHRHVIFASALVLAPGCYQGSDEAADIATTRSIGFNNVALQGIHLQGINLQGINLQGINLQGINLQGINLQGINLQGINLQGINLQGTEFGGLLKINGKWIWRSGEDLIGAEWRLRIAGKDENGKPTTEDFVLRFDDIYLDPNYDDVWLYDVSYRPKLDNTWKPLCSDGKGNALPAIPLQNYWDAATGDRIDDEDVVTFSCTNAVLAKCVEWGYRPWAEATRCKDVDKNKHCYDVSLQDYHQACTRMARADYCGDGKPWTVPGTAIDIWDHLSPQIEAPATDWTIEAEWTPDGAYCLDDIRQQAWKEQGLYPKCFLDKKGKPKTKKDCGSLKKHRALLVSAFNKYGEPLP